MQLFIFLNAKTLYSHFHPFFFLISGPVTVPMVSTNPSPPIAMPVQVPHGHVVQQIVDENGTLRHVIISQHPSGVMQLPSHHHHYVSKPFFFVPILVQRLFNWLIIYTIFLAWYFPVTKFIFS